VSGSEQDEVAPPPPGPASGTGTEPEWSINWPGAGVLLVVIVVGLVAWRSLGGGDADVASSSGIDVAGADGSTQPPTASTAMPTTTLAATTTLAPATVAPTTSTAPERRVIIRGEIEPCRFGDRCLVASFTLEGFEQTSGEFVCIYPNSMSQFSYRDGGREDACLTADEGDTIAIEVDGVRSAVISEANLTGTP
jgi:hypothetical protein